MRSWRSRCQTTLQGLLLPFPVIICWAPPDDVAQAAEASRSVRTFA